MNALIIIIYLRQVSIIAWQAEIEFLGLVVGQYPGKHRVLIQVVVRSSCNRENKRLKKKNNNIK